MLKARIIPCLDVKDGRVVKGVNFVGLRDAGDPVFAFLILPRQAIIGPSFWMWSDKPQNNALCH